MTVSRVFSSWTENEFWTVYVTRLPYCVPAEDSPPSLHQKDEQEERRRKHFFKADAVIEEDSKRKKEKRSRFSI